MIPQRLSNLLKLTLRLFEQMLLLGNKKRFISYLNQNSLGLHIRHQINLIYGKRKIEPLVEKQKHRVSVGLFALVLLVSVAAACLEMSAEDINEFFHSLEKYMLPPVIAKWNLYRFHLSSYMCQVIQTIAPLPVCYI